MTGKFTPGPWRIFEEESTVWQDINPDDPTSYGVGFPVAEACRPPSWGGARPTVEERLANARLIASAPDMLAALKAIPFPSPFDTAREHYERFYTWLQNVAQPAIKRAETQS